VPESLTLEYKQQYTDKIPTSIAAMANTYGGIVLVGVAEGGGDRLLGVPEDTIVRIVSACHAKLEPPWEPEIVPVQLPGRPELFILVVRIDPAQAPRPLLERGAAPIRLHGRNAIADRPRLESLFEQSNVPRNISRFQAPAPQIARDSKGEPEADFMVSTGLAIPLSNDAAWRPLSERGIDNLASSLNGSPLSDRLQAWNLVIGREGHRPFSPAGLNRSRHARLAWLSVPDVNGIHPIEAVATALIPETYGQSASFLQFTVDVTLRESAFLKVFDGLDAQAVSIEADDLRGLLQDLCATLTNRDVTRRLAEMSGTDLELVRQPNVVHFVTGPPVIDLLSSHGLTPIPDAGTSRGARLLTNPARDLGDDLDRRDQVAEWMIQIALDAGLRGMEALISATKG